MLDSTQKLIAEFLDLFHCRRDAYAEGYRTSSGKMGYPPARDNQNKDLPLTYDVILKHLQGEIYLGVYPLFDEKYVKWLAIDFDGNDEEDPLEAAKKQKNKLLDAGIISYIERSRSGNGAHVWVFLDEAIEASVIRNVINKYSIKSEASTFDRMFPNQDSAQGGYGNLIALPYQGKDYGENKNSCFIDDDGKAINPRKFISQVRRNDVGYIRNIYTDSLPDTSKFAKELLENADDGTHTKQSLSGALKVVTFSNWIKAARERMPKQNQEPEFYALCCQFAQLEDGERLAYEFGRLHPYNDARIAEKFEQAKRVNKPHSCKTLREEFGWEETADMDYGVTFPYELAKLSFKDLLGGRRGNIYSWKDLGQSVITTAKDLYKRQERLGWPYGYDALDNLTELRKGNLIVLGARTKIGKSSWAIDLTGNLNERGIPVYWASLEMTKEELANKYLSRLANVDSKLLRRGDLGFYEWRRVLEAYKKFKELPFYVNDEVHNVDKMIDVFSNMVAAHGPGLIVVDYIELISKGPGEGDMAMTNRAIVEFKHLAKILEVPILVLSNFNRKAEQDMMEDVDPMDSWVRNSGMIEQTVDILFYLLGNKGKGIVERKLRVQADRHDGISGEEISLWFDGAVSRFYDSPPKGSEKSLDLGGLLSKQLVL